MPSRRLRRKPFACFPRSRATDVAPVFLLQLARKRERRYRLRGSNHLSYIVCNLFGQQEATSAYATNAPWATKHAYSPAAEANLNTGSVRIISRRNSPPPMDEFLRMYNGIRQIQDQISTKFLLSTTARTPDGQPGGRFMWLEQFRHWSYLIPAYRRRLTDANDPCIDFRELPPQRWGGVKRFLEPLGLLDSRDLSITIPTEPASGWVIGLIQWLTKKLKQHIKDRYKVCKNTTVLWRWYYGIVQPECLLELHCAATRCTDVDNWLVKPCSMEKSFCSFGRWILHQNGGWLGTRERAIGFSKCYRLPSMSSKESCIPWESPRKTQAGTRGLPE